jgi:hypothetical protein
MLSPKSSDGVANHQLASELNPVLMSNDISFKDGSAGAYCLIRAGG